MIELLVFMAVVSAAGAGRSALQATTVHRSRQRLHGLAPRGFRAPPVRLPVPPVVASAYAATGARPDVATVFSAWVAVTFVAAAFVGVIESPVLGGVMLAQCVAAPAIAASVWADRRTRLVETALPDALESIAQSVRSGASLTQAIGVIAGGRDTDGTVGRCDLREGFAEVLAIAGGGATLASALEQWARTRAEPGVRLAGAALALAADAGGPQARAIDGVAATLRDRVAVSRELDALAAQGRLSGIVIAVAPLAFAALTTATDRRTAAYLFHSVAGNACLAVGLALDLLGALWMARITAGATR